VKRLARPRVAVIARNGPTSAAEAAARSSSGEGLQCPMRGPDRRAATPSGPRSSDPWQDHAGRGT
jgi:hypothetical protein